MSRETRLLLATIAISAIVVLALSTLRFPESPRLTEAPPAPLERLAASAAYEQLARIVERVARRVRPDLLVVRTSRTATNQPRSFRDLLAQPVSASLTRHYPALRIDNERAVVAAAVAENAVVLLGETAVEVDVLASDPVRQLTLLHVPPAEATNVSPLTLSDLQTPTYVVVAEGTAAGVAFRPVFVGSADRFTDGRWQRPLLAVSGTALTSSGALVFSLEGQFIGVAVVPENGTFAVAGAAELLAAANELAAGEGIAPQDFGITVQRLTAPLGRSLKATEGVVVVSVDPSGPGAGLFEPLDVITSIDGRPFSQPEELLLQMSRAKKDRPLLLQGVRAGERFEWTLPSSAERPAAPTTPVPLVLGRVAGVGSLVRTLPPDTPVGRSGLRTGDLIVRAGSVAAPTPAQVTALLRRVAEGDGLILVVRRDDLDELIVVAAGTP